MEVKQKRGRSAEYNRREAGGAARKALRSEAAGRVYGKHGGYRQLKARKGVKRKI